MSNLRSEIDHLYASLDANMRDGRSRRGSLANLDILAGLPELDRAGVYFVYEPGEIRETGGPRVVRVGQANNIRDRIKQHREGSSSAFSQLVLEALASKHGRTAFYPYLAKSWKDIPDPPQQDMRSFVRTTVNPYMATVEFTWLPVQDERLRNKIELWATVLLSNYWRQGAPIDPPSSGWLAKALLGPGGSSASRMKIATYNKVVRSGLWSDQFVDLDLTDGCCWDFERLIRSGP